MPKVKGRSKLIVEESARSEERTFRNIIGIMLRPYTLLLIKQWKKIIPLKQDIMLYSILIWTGEIGIARNRLKWNIDYFLREMFSFSRRKGSSAAFGRNIRKGRGISKTKVGSLKSTRKKGGKTESINILYFNVGMLF